MILSIIIPSFQQGKYLKDALLSIKSQNFVDYEILIIDGGSTDSTEEVVSLFNFLPIRFCQESDEGVYDAMNKGILQAQGEWIYFMGCDDELYNNNVLNEFAVIFAKKNIDMFYGDVILTSTKKRYAGQFDLNKLLRECNICHQAIFYRKSVFDKLGYYNLKYKTWADWEFNLRCFRHTELVIKYYDVVVASYNDMSGISNTYDVVFGEEIPMSYINRINLLEEQKTSLLNSKSFLVGNKIINFLNKITINKKN